MGLKRVTKVCRVLFLSSLAIAYLAAYFSLSSNSEFSIPEGDVSYVDRQNRNETTTTTPTESLYDSRQSKIRRTAAKISRVYKPVRYKKRNRINNCLITWWYCMRVLLTAYVTFLIVKCYYMIRLFSRTLQHGVSMNAWNWTRNPNNQCESILFRYPSVKCLIFEFRVEKIMLFPFYHQPLLGDSAIWESLTQPALLSRASTCE